MKNKVLFSLPLVTILLLATLAIGCKNTPFTVTGHVTTVGLSKTTDQVPTTTVRFRNDDGKYVRLEFIRALIPRA